MARHSQPEMTTRTRRDGEAPGRQSAGPAPVRKSLVTGVTEDLRQSILGRKFHPGDKLPSEAGLTRQYSVSRTVIREAVACLRADGLLDARHGVGVFVVGKRLPSNIALRTIDTAKLSSIIEGLELRTAVELEAASLAASRCSPAQEAAIWECHDAFAKLVAEGRPTVESDFSFHLAIADASANGRFREFLEMMGRRVIPRSALGNDQAEVAPPNYLEQIQAEHRRIADAISAHDERAARDEMRTHLQGSLQRYRSLIGRA